MSTVEIVKSTGERESFRPDKLRSSLRRAGASPKLIDRITERVLNKIRPGMTTREIYRIAFNILRHAPKPTAARFSMQRAVAQLGPSGYPFEEFVAAIYRALGYRVSTGVTIRGKLVGHEIDVVAGRDDDRLLAECKFRNQNHGKVDVKVAMYIYARSLDLANGPERFDRFALMTNGKFTEDALRYGLGVGLQMVSWSHPDDDNLPLLIERAGVVPLTCLSSLRVHDRQALMSRGTVLVSDLLDDRGCLRPLRLDAKRERDVIVEAEAILERAGSPG